jgi:hypothetical protein
MHREIHENWFQKHFIPEVWAFLWETEKELPQQAVLLPDNNPTDPKVSILASNNGLTTAKLLLPNVIAITKPRDQGMMLSG